MESSSASYTVLARRYRPQGFDEVIGQEHIAQSLRNAIRSGRVAHAYLFTGARGVGKTSTARILAKALNCPHAVDGMPCNQCDVCESVSAGRDVDVQEIDGASNNGVENIRQLRANVAVTSMRSQFKIYIIDEVHMLSTSAFNALLKTLEEPPPNVKFVFCTTEPNKVPDTILSRCQRFDFGTISMAKIIDRLASIAQSEQMEVEPAALELVARRAAGSMRDSQSLFDQLLASSDQKITATEVHRLLGTASDERLMEMFAAIIVRQRNQVLNLLSQALAEGAQLEELATQFLNYLRDLLVLAAGAENVPLLSVSETNRSHLIQQAQTWTLNTIVAALQVMSEAKLKMSRQTFARALVELALIRLTLLEQLQSLDALLTDLSNGSLSISAPSASGAPTNLVAADDSQKKKPEPVTDTRQEVPSAHTASTTSTSTFSQSNSPVSVAPDAVQSAEPAPHIPAESSEPSPTGNALTETLDVPPNEGSADDSRSRFLTATPVETPPKPASSTDFRPGAESSIWAQVLTEIGDDFGIHFRKVSRVAIFGPNRLELTFPKSYLFAKSFCEKPEVRGRLEEVVARLAGQPVQVILTVGPDEASAETVARSPASARRVDLSTNGDPYVERALELFNAKVMKKETVVRTASEG